MQEENLIKRVRKKYNLSYAELAEITGAKESTLKNASSTGDISDIIKKSIEWYMKAKEKEKEIDNIQYFKTALQTFLNE